MLIFIGRCSKNIASTDIFALHKRLFVSMLYARGYLLAKPTSSAPAMSDLHDREFNKLLVARLHCTYITDTDLTKEGSTRPTRYPHCGMVTFDPTTSIIGIITAYDSLGSKSTLIIPKR